MYHPAKYQLLKKLCRPDDVSGTNDKGELGIIRAVDYLVSRGYDEREVVQNYSIRKINALFTASVKNESYQNRMIGCAVRMGTNANSEEFLKWVKAV